MRDIFKLSNYSVSSVPTWSQVARRACNHLTVNGKVAITVQGLKDHNEYNAFTKIGALSTVGLLALPILGVTGGLGLAMGGEAIGFSLAELTIASTLTGTAVGVGTANATKLTGHKTSQDNLELVNMVGVLLRKKTRWTNSKEYDVFIEWKAQDSWGDLKTFKSWHNPTDIVGLEYNY